MSKNLSSALLIQVSSLSKNLATVTAVLTTTRAALCDKTEGTSMISRRNIDYMDGLDKRSLIGSVTISIQDHKLKEKMGIKGDTDYNNINVEDLTQAVANP